MGSWYFWTIIFLSLWDFQEGFGISSKYRLPPCTLAAAPRRGPQKYMVVHICLRYFYGAFIEKIWFKCNPAIHSWMFLRNISFEAHFWCFTISSEAHFLIHFGVDNDEIGGSETVFCSPPWHTTCRGGDAWHAGAPPETSNEKIGLTNLQSRM